MGNDDNSGSSGSQGNFWTTLPGVITAFTGLIGAITALIAGLHQAGLLTFLPTTPTMPATPPPQVPVLDTPEDLLVDFYRFLIKRQFDEAQVIYPALDGEDMEDWLGGLGTRSPTVSISMLRDAYRLAGSDRRVSYVVALLTLL